MISFYKCPLRSVSQKVFTNNVIFDGNDIEAMILKILLYKRAHSYFITPQFTIFSKLPKIVNCGMSDE